jgi:hypothetical protein
MAYPGGKGGAGVAQLIINQQPPHRRYFELFLGGGSVMLQKRPAPVSNVGIDLEASAIREFPGIGGKYPLTLLQQNAISFLEDNQFDSQDLIYCDPPYLFSSRRRPAPLYFYEFGSEKQHGRLLALLLGLPSMIQISGYWSRFYARILKGWRLVRYTATTRGGPAEECLWMNYPEPAALHDYSFLGDGFRERERIKRKTARWVSRIASLPQLERTALLSAMIAGIASSDERIRPRAALATSDEGSGLPGRLAGSGEGGRSAGRLARNDVAGSCWRPTPHPAMVDRSTPETEVLQ